MRTCLIACAKSEGPHLLEWVAWHRLVGFDDIIVAQNDSDDGTVEILAALQDIGAVVAVDNSPPEDSGQSLTLQARGYARAAEQPAYRHCDWAPGAGR